MKDFIRGNKDDVEKAVDCLNEFTHNWCMNCEETEKQNDLVFRCKECHFFMEDESCLIKKFKNKHYPNYRGFGSMGDL